MPAPQEFIAFAVTLREDVHRLEEAVALLGEVTGMGTDHNVTTDPDSAEAVPWDEMTGELPLIADPKR